MKTQRILVAYGSKHGATAGIAEEIAHTLDGDGFETEVVPAREVHDVERFDAVVLGGSLYAGHWHRDAVRCAHRNEAALTHRPVWLFSSGPVDSSAEQHEIPPVPSAAKELRRLHAKGHATFGGSITAETPGFVARTLVKHNKGGDFRNPEQIQRWAHRLGAELRAGEKA
ncbi:menaquinone-dependent protoporphyrinogen oxidase [Kitasatospora sp. GP30]|uniref:flavodoxin domain-containing protein n=1 Tax=Kitasatospora sp. GP30 TaxID=3035084 RepID=UPI000C6FCF0C|nr:flavodoxin domain-containing protein [Kitasatospora sp. GP30]MDH6144297.1 menaquinone-dependent protoporphyrinogen oxidase [Kitasatospora sp. GP30]